MKLLILSLLSMVSISSWAQELIHNESTITVQAGAVLYVEGTMLNTATGVIANSGTIELKGDFTNGNPAGWNSPNPNTLKFSGDLASNVTSNGAQFYDVVVQKGTTFNVNLLDAMNVTHNLDFNAPAAGTGNKVNLGSNNLIMGSAATVTGFDADEYVLTGGTGYMKKTLASGSFQFPLGFDAATYNPATMNVTAGPSDTYQARVLASPTNGNGLTGTPLTTQVVNAVWDINEAAAGGNTYDLTLGWTVGDELPGFSETANAISRNDGVNGWDALFSGLGGSGTTRTRTGLNAFGAFAVGGKAVANTLLVDAKVLLQGPYVSALMVDSLRVHNYIPLTEPYTAAPYNYLHKAYGGGEAVTSAAIFDQPLNADDIVDWVVVELRSAPTTIVATKSGLLQRDGNIVDVDGVSKLSVQGVADGSYYIGVRHRNHLGVRSNALVSLSNAPSALVDFTLLATAFDDPAVTKPTDPMKLLTGGLYGLHSGDAGFNGLVSYNGASNDKNIVLTTVGPATPNNVVSGYNRADVNMNGVTLYNGALNDKNVILVNVGPATPNDVLTAHNNN
ncbi:MAG: hypothetical protein IPP15_14375 [Saprospiraceae bacterium]|uniref:Uncharacterized protein n=1 Tax=Candidatus Opimibacter skivensis TaxID=2982028 RepID=A0A9D7XTD1_9BACT|nr:hypothetical protein [Candidatus Opimibacter skivensis]